MDPEDSRHPETENVKGTFMLIGAEAAENIGLMQRLVREGNEVGNHTYTQSRHQRNLAAAA